MNIMKILKYNKIELIKKSEYSGVNMDSSPDLC